MSNKKISIIFVFFIIAIMPRNGLAVIEDESYFGEDFAVQQVSNEPRARMTYQILIDDIEQEEGHATQGSAWSFLTMDRGQKLAFSTTCNIARPISVKDFTVIDSHNDDFTFGFYISPPGNYADLGLIPVTKSETVGMEKYYTLTMGVPVGIEVETVYVRIMCDYEDERAEKTIQFSLQDPVPTDEDTTGSESDNDGDGFDNTEDCNDSDAAINPDATEVCDGVDNNCDGSVDEGFTVSVYYLDADGDGYGTSRVSVSVCSQLAGYVTNDDDCDDSQASIHPGAEEICDNVDNDCDGVVDGADCVTPVDADGDGYLSGLDCDDGNASINPGASDDCTNQIDMNCDGVVSNCSVVAPQIDGTTVQGVGVTGEVSGGADVAGCGCVVMGDVNPYSLSTVIMLVMTLLSGVALRFSWKK